METEDICKRYAEHDLVWDEAMAALSAEGYSPGEANLMLQEAATDHDAGLN